MNALVAGRGARGFAPVFAVLCALLVGCRSAAWQVPNRLAPSARALSEALGEPPVADDTSSRVPASLPTPTHTRACCAFGMDLRARMAGIQPPFVLPNVLNASDARGH